MCLFLFFVVVFLIFVFHSVVLPSAWSPLDLPDGGGCLHQPRAARRLVEHAVDLVVPAHP